jgi:hypothetical protein
LVDHAHDVASQRHQALLGRGGDLRVAHEDPALVGTLEAGDEAEQGRLPRAGTAGERDEPTPGDDQVETAQRVDRVRALAVGLVDAAQADACPDTGRASVSRLAAMSGSAAFFAPLIGSEPFSRRPPLTLILSIRPT